MVNNIYDDYASYTQKFKKEYGEQTIVLIEVGSFWELYDCDQHLGANMKDIGELLNIQVSKKNKNIPDISSSNPQMAGFPSFALTKFLPVLLNADYTVVLVGQVTPPPNPKRDVTKILSKGTYIDELDSAKTNNIMCIFEEKGAAIIDLATGSSYIHESHNQDDFYKLISIYKPCELILLRSNMKFPIPPYSKIYNQDHFDVNKLPYQIEILSKVFENKSMLSIVEYLDLERFPFALAAFSIVVNFCMLHNPSVVKYLKKPISAFENSMLNMYYNTIDQLDIEGLNKIINKCVTSMGKRYFKKRLFNPFSSESLIVKSLNEIKSIGSVDEALAIQKDLKNVYDLERLFRKVELGTLKIEDICQISQSCSVFEDTKDLSKFIEASIDLASNTIKGDADIQKMLRKKQDINNELILIVENLNKECNVEYLKLDGYQITLTQKRYKDILKVNAKPFSDYRAVNLTNVVKLSHPKLSELSDKNDKIDLKLSSLMRDKYKVFLQSFYEAYHERFDNIVDSICKKDFTSTCYLTAHKYRYSYPEVNGGSISQVEFKDIRHPIIERINDSEPYIGNDLMINGTGTLLYGLNAAGKSSLIKAIGLNIIMAQCGMYVAASKMILTPYISIFCRISKSDNLYAGQSTFMVEMSELRKILNHSCPNSLVLADELCAGTESVSSISIVASAINYLNKKNCGFVLATHLHELTKIPFVNDVNNIFHLDVFFDKVNDILVYNRKLCNGQGSELYGLEVCKSLDMNKEFLKVAEEVRSKFIKPIKKSRYNSRLLVHKCSICDQDADEVHHIKEQSLADKDGFIGNIHKNRKSNLVTLCKTCHEKCHKNEIIIEGYKNTSVGVKLVSNSKLH